MRKEKKKRSMKEILLLVLLINIGFILGILAILEYVMGLGILD